MGAIIEGLCFPFSTLLEKRLNGIKCEYINAQKNKHTASFDMRGERTVATVGMVNDIINEFVTGVWKCPTIDEGPCIAEYRRDVLCLFASEAGVSHLSADTVEQTVYRLLDMLGCSDTKVDLGWLHVFLWGHCDFISAMLNMLYVGEDQPALTLLSDPDRLLELCERDGASSEDVAAVVKVTVYDVVEQFCCTQWQYMKDICMSSLELSTLNV